ncbi:BtrH N-terminal domain-containing protein [Pseudonocardia alni]|uniref:BtrH N-terminal domain-containing protein n=1 Tax=Pseudonocardia alni TaxID=33907 RepID=UPI0009FA2F38|nr:BtrH N-terminal domain-containing protein [Pseudonocardia sp. AL041005-10]
MKIIADYPHNLAGHCGSGALRDLLEWASLSYEDEPMKEGFVFGLAGELSFRYLKGPGLGTPFYLVGRGADLTTKLCGRLAIECEVRTTDSPDLGWRWLRDEIDQGYPLLCWADMKDLPYLNVQMRMSRHDIVAIGYGISDVTVVDNDRELPQSLRHIDLVRARNSHGFPTPTRNTCYPMRFPKSLPLLHETAASALRASAENMLDDRPSSFLGNHNVEISEAVGLDGVKFFARDVERWGAATDEDQLAAAHSLLAVFIEKAGTGGGLFRRLQAEFLDRLSELTSDSAVIAAARTWRDLAEAWTLLAMTAKDSSTAPAVRQKFLAQIAQTLPDLERAATKSLIVAADSLVASPTMWTRMIPDAFAPTEPQ